MDIPTPQPAQVIRYAYLWAAEHAAGREDGVKDRPAAVVMTLQTANEGMRVAVVPITHSPPLAGTDALEIPANIKRHLGLDDERSWVVLNELNVFSWPGPDLRPVTADYNASPLYGMLPAGFFRTIRDRLVANIKAGRIQQIPRTE